MALKVQQTVKAQRVASIPIPRLSLQSLLDTASATKSAVDVLVGSVGGEEQRAVTFVDLINMGLITPDQVPAKYGTPPRKV